MKQVTYENRITDQTVKEVAQVRKDYFATPSPEPVRDLQVGQPHQ